MAKQPIPTMVIGLGGSGAWTVVHTKKQLLDTYDNEMPDNVALAVMDTAPSIARLGAEGVKREEGKGIGQVEIDKREYVHVGGDTYNMVESVASKKRGYEHIESWFLADHYLKNLSRNLFYLEEGAGQYRQFGRLALFRDVMAPANSAVVSIVEKKLIAIANQAVGEPSIAVMIIGSLAGGTGAGLFLDVPHLIRQVALQRNINVSLRGFFYLPQAFRGTLKGTEIEPAKARAFAALRELQRFMLNEDYQYGYPMYYHPEQAGMDKSLWRAQNRGKLYDFVYLIDGEINRVNTRQLKDGAAGVVADAIVSFMDGTYGPEQRQYDVNVRAKIAERQGRIGKRTFVSALGAYSIILPVQQMTEGWAYRLGLDFMRMMLPAEQSSDRGYIIQLASDKTAEATSASSRSEVERLLKSDIPLTDATDPDNRRQIHPLRLWRDTYRFYTEQLMSEAQIMTEINTYGLGQWLAMLVPLGVAGQGDPIIQRAVLETQNILNDSIENHAKISTKRKPKGDWTSDWRDISNSANSFIRQQLGAEESGGGRSGGRYADALDRFQQLQLSRFQAYIMAYANETLNGPSSANAQAGKQGKLGWLIAVLEEMQRVFAQVYEMFERIRAGKGTAESSHRANLNDRFAGALSTMTKKANETGLFAERAAVGAQENFLATVQEYVNFYRMDFARLAVSRTISMIRNFLKQTLEEFYQWRSLLATDSNSLFTLLLDGSRRVRGERERAGNIKNHLIIDDLNWEDRKYNEYMTTSDGKNRLFGNWRWTSRLDNQGKLSLGASLGDSSINSSMRGRWAEENLEVVLGFVRKIFRAAITDMTVLEYLMETYTGREAELATELAKQAGSLLHVPVNNLTSGQLPSNILLVQNDDKVPNQQSFLQQITTNLIAEQNRGDVGKGKDQQSDPINQFYSIGDPFRLTYLSLTELIPMDGVTAYEDCLKSYMSLPRDTRMTAHIFPAEVRAVNYEEKLKTLKQERRILTQRVSLLLEREARFKEFLFLLSHRIVAYIQNEDVYPATEHFWAIVAPSTNARRQGQLEHWWLSESKSDSTSLMEAMITYVIQEKDYRSLRPNASEDIEIPYSHVLEYLNWVQRQDTAERVKRDQLAYRYKVDKNDQRILDADDEPIAEADADLRAWLEAFMPNGDYQTVDAMLGEMSQQELDDYLRVANLIVRHDMMQELVDDLFSQLPELKESVESQQEHLDTGKDHDALRSAQEDYDLYSISIIALQQEIENLRSVIQNLYDQKTGRNSRKGIIR